MVFMADRGLILTKKSRPPCRKKPRLPDKQVKGLHTARRLHD